MPHHTQDPPRTSGRAKNDQARSDHAKELILDPNKIGEIGFSAGGYLVAQTSNIFEPTYKSVDAVDKLSSRPDFAIALYPGHLCRYGATLDPGIHVTKQTPPTFLLQAWDDPVDRKSATARSTRAPLMMRASRQRSISLPRAGTPSAEAHRTSGVDVAFAVANWLKESRS